MKLANRSSLVVWAYRHLRPGQPDPDDDPVVLSRSEVHQREGDYNDGRILWVRTGSVIQYLHPNIRRRFFPALAPGDCRRVVMQRLAEGEPNPAPGDGLVAWGYAGLESHGYFTFAVAPEILTLNDDAGQCFCQYNQIGSGFHVCHEIVQKILAPEVVNWRLERDGYGEGSGHWVPGYKAKIAVPFRLAVRDCLSGKQPIGTRRFSSHNDPYDIPPTDPGYVSQFRRTLTAMDAQRVRCPRCQQQTTNKRIAGKVPLAVALKEVFAHE